MARLRRSPKQVYVHDSCIGHLALFASWARAEFRIQRAEIGLRHIVPHAWPTWANSGPIWWALAGLWPIPWRIEAQREVG